MGGIVGFLKVRNEIIRGNLIRCLENMTAICDAGVICDDASTDGTREYLKKHFEGDYLTLYPFSKLVLVPPKEQSFRKELHWKNVMMERVHQMVRDREIHEPDWIWWQDADEEVPEPHLFREWVRSVTNVEAIAWRFRYTQVWGRGEAPPAWARTDDQFDDGSFIKLWRYSPDLSFEVRDGTHHHQFPKQIAAKLDGRGQSPYVKEAPFDVVHWGNYGKALQFKAHQYYGGLGGVDRHLYFDKATFRAFGRSDAPKPVPYTPEEIALIKSMKDLKSLPQTFCVIIPTHNRAGTLDAALQSLVNQTYKKWIAIVLDDGSTDDTEAVMAKWIVNPQVFYAKYPKRGAVWVNERGMDLACEMTEWWTRLGSDDYFMPHKLELDAAALKTAEAVYAPYRVLRGETLGETCNPKMTSEHIRDVLTSGGFVVSWANIAVRCSVLAKVKEKYGSYCDSRLVNCEDFLINARIARMASFQWREPGAGGYDAIWRVAADGASSNTTQTGEDERMTRVLISDENK